MGLICYDDQKSIGINDTGVINERDHKGRRHFVQLNIEPGLAAEGHPRLDRAGV
jgi:hypothetical protein